jgi:hypothetical protein
MDDLDRVLLREAEIRPSSGFTRSVMAAVRNAATSPPPIPFPWKRALPGLAVFAIAITWGLLEAFRSPVRESASAVSLTHWLDGVVPLIDKAQMFGAGWILVGLLLTFAGLKLTWHLAGRRL